jgi:hypothetical protein
MESEKKCTNMYEICKGKDQGNKQHVPYMSKMSQVRVAKGIPNQPLLKQTRFSNSLAKQKNTKKYLRPPKKNKK